MGLPPAAEAVDEEDTREWPRAPATLGVADCLSAVAGEETPASESWFACSPAARIRAAALEVAKLTQRIDELVMR